MPRVQQAQNTVQIQRNQVQTQQVANLGQGIVGNNVFEQAQSLGRTVQEGIGKVGDAYNAFQEAESKKKVEKSLVDFQGEFKERLYSTEQEELKDEKTGEKSTRIKGLLKRELGSAKDTSQEFDKVSQELLSKYTESMNDFEKKKFLDSSANYLMNTSESIYKHEQNEMQKDFEENHKASISSLIDRSIDYSSVQAVKSDLNLALTKNEEFGKLKGMGKESLDQMKRNTVDAFANASVMKKIESSASEARTYLESMKDQMNESTYAKLDSAIKGKEFFNTKVNMWDSQFSHMKLSDGNIDIEKINSTIQKMDGYTDEQKADLSNHMKAKAGEARAIRGQQREALDRNFTNQVFTGKDQGKSFDDLMKLAHDFSEDATDRASKETMVRKLFESAKVKTDPVEHYKLWEGIQTGTVKVEDIDKAMDANKIDGNDWQSLRQMIFKQDNGKDGKAPGMDEIKMLAEREFGSKKEAKAQFMYTVERKIKEDNLTKEQAIIYANDMIKKSGSWFSRKYDYTKDYAKFSNNDLMVGELQNTIGADMYKIIGTTQKDASPSSITKFADQFGGVEQLRTGSPINQAIMYLRENRKPITKENVDKLVGVLTQK